MRRDWPAVAAGFGILALSGAVAAIAALAYGVADPPPCQPPGPPLAGTDGCPSAGRGSHAWIAQPGVIVLLTIALLLFLIALVTIWRGWAARDRASRRSAK
jgi:hypothetical protein